LASSPISRSPNGESGQRGNLGGLGEALRRAGKSFEAKRKQFLFVEIGYNESGARQRSPGVSRPAAITPRRSNNGASKPRLICQPAIHSSLECSGGNGFPKFRIITRRITGSRLPRSKR
jgi:hypothetical protein